MYLSVLFMKGLGWRFIFVGWLTAFVSESASVSTLRGLPPHATFWTLLVLVSPQRPLLCGSCTQAMPATWRRSATRSESTPSGRERPWSSPAWSLDTLGLRWDTGCDSKTHELQDIRTFHRSSRPHVMQIWQQVFWPQYWLQKKHITKIIEYNWTYS